MDMVTPTNRSSALPFFSVVLTSYNRAKLLKRAFRSLTQQTETDWEAVIIDDGSTDDSYNQLLPYLDIPNPLMYFKQASQGCAASKNAGMFLSTGRYITFLDSDDEYDPEHLASRKKILLQNPQVELLHGGITIVGSPFVPDRFNLQKMIHLQDCVIGGTFFIKRHLVNVLHGFEDIALGHDADFMERATCQGASILKTDLPTYIYHRETQNSITNNLSTSQTI